MIFIEHVKSLSLMLVCVLVCVMRIVMPTTAIMMMKKTKTTTNDDNDDNDDNHKHDHRDDNKSVQKNIELKVWIIFFCYMGYKRLSVECFFFSPLFNTKTYIFLFHNP